MSSRSLPRRMSVLLVVLVLGTIIVPATTASVGAQTGQARGWLDRAVPVAGGAEIAGWAVDPDRPADAVTVHVYADGRYVDGRRASAFRPDVNAALGVSGGHGFGWTIPLATGTHEVCVYALGLDAGGARDGDNPRIGCRTVRVGGSTVSSNGPAPRGHIDRAYGSDAGITLAGWALDDDSPSTSLTIQVWSDGRFLSCRLADSRRPDVNSAFGVTGNHGFGWTVPVGPGIHDVCLYAMGVGATGARSAPDTLLGCRSITVGGEAAADVQTRLLQLGYWHTDPAGTFGASTSHAVTALQKVAGLPRTGVVDDATRRALDDGVRPAARSRSGYVVEVDLDAQVVLVVDRGHVVTILDSSTGKPSTPTPPGRFEMFRNVNAWDPGPYGSLYRPIYFVGGIAVHGFGSVPTQAASHGCVRVTIEAMDWIWANNVMPLGTDVLVY